VSAGSLVVFAKAPRPGTVKTRLCPPLRPEQAAELYACMLDDVLETSAAACRELHLAALLAVHPPDAVAELAARAPGFHVLAQRGADLGERMEAAAAEAAGRLPGAVLLRGSDSPALSLEAIRAALAALASADLVVAPGADGGYDLIALAAPAPGLFRHPMSTSSVLDDTLAAARARGLGCQVLPFQTFDLDTPPDLARLAAARRAAQRSGSRVSFSRTAGYLDRHQLWDPAQLC